MKPTRIKIFSGSYLTMHSACHECRKKYTAPCEELWASGECIMPMRDYKKDVGIQKKLYIKEA